MKPPCFFSTSPLTLDRVSSSFCSHTNSSLETSNKGSSLFFFYCTCASCRNVLFCFLVSTPSVFLAPRTRLVLFTDCRPSSAVLSSLSSCSYGVGSAPLIISCSRLIISASNCLLKDLGPTLPPQIASPPHWFSEQPSQLWHISPQDRSTGTGRLSDTAASTGILRPSYLQLQCC